MSILSQLATTGVAKAAPALLDRLEIAAPNQFPMYAELALAAVPPSQRPRFQAMLESRLAKIDQPARLARVGKVLRQLQRA